jgi:hypothetical protein
VIIYEARKKMHSVHFGSSFSSRLKLKIDTQNAEAHRDNAGPSSAERKEVKPGVELERELEKGSASKGSQDEYVPKKG